MIHLKAFIETHKLDKKKVARLLFPKNNHPMHALDRVINYKGLLDSSQIITLVNYANVPIQTVFNKHGWKTGVSPEGVITLTKGDNTATLCTRTWVSRVYLKGKLLSDTLISKSTISMRDYVANIEEIFSKQ